MKHLKRILVLTLLISFAAIKASYAQSVETIGEYDNWTAYSYVGSEGKVCYIASMPKKDEGNYTKRGDIFTLVTHRPSKNSFDVVSVVAGYTYKSGSQVSVRIGSQNFTLFTYDETAWAQNSSVDDKLVKAMEKGVRMVIKGTSSRGTLTTDSYSLVGFTDALEAINKTCGR